MKTNVRHNLSQRGFTLIEAMISLGVMAIVGLGAAGMSVMQSNGMKESQRKSEALNLKNNLISSLSLDACTCLLNSTNNTVNTYPLSFNSNDPLIANRKIQLKTIYGGCDVAKHPSFPIVTEDSILPDSQTKLKIAKIYLSQIQPVGSLTPNTFQGQFEVNFDADGKVSRQPVIVAQRFEADMTDPANVKIVSCVPPVLPAVFVPSNTMTFDVAGVSQTFTVPDQVIALRVRLVGGGGGGAGAGHLDFSPWFWSGGGGGSGGYSERWISVSPGTVYGVYVGRGGTGGAAYYDNYANDGEGTYFNGPGVTMSATPGKGGHGTHLGDLGGGPPGIGSGGQMNMWGGYGGDGVANGAQGGNGGGSYFGGGGRTAQGYTPGGFSDGKAPGSGGGGGWGGDTIRGGDGAKGVVIIEW